MSAFATAHDLQISQADHGFPGAPGRQPASPSVPSSFVRAALRGPGRPLDPATRSLMEARFDHDFSHVHVHTDARAAASADAVGARAYTVGNQIAFAGGEFAPATAAGRRLLAHELVHVVQQADAPEVTGELELAPHDDEYEREAEHAAIGVASAASETFAVSPVHGRRLRRVLARQVQTLCIPPSAIVAPGPAAQFGELAEKIIIDAAYCTQMGCAPFATDYFDNPIAASYVAFIVAHNPRLNNARDIATLAIASLIGLNRPDILTDNGVRREFYEIKPNSPTGLVAGAAKLLAIEAFMGIWSLPYVPGTVYIPATPMIKVAVVNVGPWPVEVFLRILRPAPGLIVYDVCFRGELAKIGVAALAAIILAIIAVLLFPEDIPIIITIPEWVPALVPILAGATAEAAPAAGTPRTEVG